jgi:hypothetical protein
VLLPDGVEISSATTGPVLKVYEAGRLDALQNLCGLEGYKRGQTVTFIGESGSDVHPDGLTAFSGFLG